MIGDGVNDAAPALATSDIGISMGVATETGDVVLMSNDIRRIPKAYKMARKVRRKIIENVVISISTKISIIGLGIAGHPSSLRRSSVMEDFQHMRPSTTFFRREEPDPTTGVISARNKGGGLVKGRFDVGKHFPAKLNTNTSILASCAE
ncbi:hypothetical protein MIMGU_mgv11b023851mg [Erythranthe guttata]|uniref:Cation-transporting P-type ATPase C-terminal domain-containing protein n=1 Tax=Erythranthe guttata TaxID=4155 RepID=A0A022QEM7_ERYGU|nr:hypothetical protein MIMGU_mgv11b023851mg [Erythranthe guttata]